MLLIGCAEQKQAEPAKAAPEAKQSGSVKPYVLATCPVSDEKLGEMGDPYVFTYEGREIKLCCNSCEKDFKKDPAKFLKKIEEAEKKGAPKS